MKNSRNSKSKTNSEEQLNEDNIEKDMDIDNIINNQIEENNEFDSDLADNSDISDEIENRINMIYNKSQKNPLLEKKGENFVYEEEKEKKKKEKYDKKIMRDIFNDYFESSCNKIDDYYEVNYPNLSKYEVKISEYSELFNLLNKKKIFPSLIENDSNYEVYNSMNDGNLFSLMNELIHHNFNIFLYGFGNKMKLLYEFIEFFQEKCKKENDIPYYIISCNLNNSEMSFKIIINKILEILKIEFKEYFKESQQGKKLSNESIFSQIEKLRVIYEKQVYNKIEDDKKNYSSSDEDFNEEDEIKIKSKNKIKDNESKEFKILMILHNIGGTLGQSKTFQDNLSELSHQLKFINIIASCENLNIPYYWTTKVKDKYKFCFIKFDTFDIYDIEIDDNNSIKGVYNIKGGEGLPTIFASFTDNAKKLMKEMAKLYLEKNYEKLTPKGLVNHFIDSGIGIVTDIQKLEELLVEPLDHEIVLLKFNNDINKDIYKFDLDPNIIAKIADGEFL